MGRRRSRRVIERAIKVYNLVVSANKISTPELFRRATSEGVVESYSALYQALRLLALKGLVTSTSSKGVLWWEPLKIVESREELEKLLSGT